jgi:nucleoside-diphosphate-sugar epimerase
MKHAAGKIKETDWCFPTTMYGCNKLYCEHLGRYYSRHYRQLAAESSGVDHIDFRSVRFPGLVSGTTIPTGGTSDYGPEMIHHAAQNLPYACFVRPDTTIPFMVMPDAIKSLLMLESAPREQLTQTVYNVTSFTPSARQFYEKVMHYFPNASIEFKPDLHRQSILDTWPEDIDDTAARRDWSWKPDYDFETSFENYLIPSIKSYYHIQ